MTCLLGDLIALGIPATAELKDRGLVVPPGPVAEAMDIGGNEPVLSFVKVVSVDGQPFVVRRAYLPLWMNDRLTDDDIRSEHLLKTISEKCGVQCVEAEQLVEAVVADSTLAADLDLNAGSPVLSVTRSTYDRRQNCIEYSVHTYRSDQNAILHRAKATAAEPRRRLDVVGHRRPRGSLGKGGVTRTAKLVSVR